MRISGVLIAAISAPVLLLTACASEGTETVRGTVIDKEYEAAVHGERNVPVKSCTTTTHKRRTTKTCTTTGSKKQKYVKKAACYELDIQLNNSDEVIEICDKAAYDALDVKDRYSSATDYSEATR